MLKPFQNILTKLIIILLLTTN